MFNLKKILILMLVTNTVFIYADSIEEIVVTGSLIKDQSDTILPAEIITEGEYKNYNITSVAEISKYLNISSGSHFQTNALDGVDQGMNSLTLRGLNHASTLVLINSRRHTQAGTPSNQGEGYTDINIIPEIALRKIEILKDGATSTYGSDAVAGVVNFITYKEYEGLKISINKQFTTNYDQDDFVLGLLYGKNYKNYSFVFGISQLNREPLSASEIPGIAELALSGLGKTFKVLDDDQVNSGIYAGSYDKNTFVPDPNCEENGGYLDGSRCRFLYGERFNIVNKESHEKIYLNLLSIDGDVKHGFNLISSKVNVKDNPQSPSYPALPFLSREINPGVGGNPFNVPVIWYGRPLGSEFESPSSPKEITQVHFNSFINFDIQNTEVEISLVNSSHKNNHYRPDIIDSRFSDALNGIGGASGNQSWDIFDSSTIPNDLIEYVRGAEISTKKANLLSIEAIFNFQNKNYKVAYGAQFNQENLDIDYNEYARAEFNQQGQIIKTADLFFLGGGINVNKSRNSSALFGEIERDFLDTIQINLAARFEKMKNESSLDPKIAFKFNLNDEIALRLSRSSAFSMPSMAQMYSSEIVLGSIRDIESSVFVRQALLGNPNLKPATSINNSLGFIYSKNNFSASLDLWEINYKNRIEIQSPQAILNTDPFGEKITRNELGDLIGVTTSYFNEEKTKIKGLDFELNFSKDFNSLGNISYSINGTNLFEFMTPDPALNGDFINRVGKFNYDSHTHSLPKTRINAFLTWDYQTYSFSFTSRYIHKYKNNRPISGLASELGYKNKIQSFLVHDLSIKKSFEFNNNNGLIKVALINIFDESAPRLYDAPDFSFDTRVHDPRGRMINLLFEYSL